MKHCPKCARTYSDDTLVFCLDDGSQLVARPELQETLRIPAPRPTDWPAPPIAPAHATPSRSRRWPIIVLLSLLLVGLLVGVIGVAIFGYSRLSASTTTTRDEQQNDRKPESWSSPSPTPSPTPRTATALVGTWRTNVSENGQSTEITVTFMSDGNTRYLFKTRGRTAADSATWQYSDGTLFERFSSGASGKGAIRWIDDDRFEITIIDNGVPAYNGLKRTYQRVR